MKAARRLELTWGRLQLLAMQRSVTLVASLRGTVVQSPLGDLEVLSRVGRDPSLPPLVCVHGFGGDKETWLLLAASLGRERGLIMFDLPGHGRSQLPNHAVTIRRHADATLRVMDHLGVRRAILCGNSMGGGVALRLAADHPARVAALVLIASVGSDVHHHAAVAAWREGPNPLIPAEHEIDEFLATALRGTTKIPRAVLRYVATTRARSAAKLHRLFEDFASGHGAEGVPQELERLDMPTLVLHGELDAIVDRATAEQLTARLPRAELHHLAHVGHAPQLEAPRRTARLLGAFLRRTAPI
ncbi:MAG: alpha/beta fold hydrolase [Kofleriaceae bacterium]